LAKGDNLLEVINMPDEQNKEETEIKKIQDLKSKIKTDDKKKQLDTVTLIATRDKLERDYQEDVITVVFNTSGETRRGVKAHKPNQIQMMTIMRLSAEAAIYEGKMDPDSLKRMVGIYANLHEMAAELCVDKKLDAQFWAEKVSFGTLQNFITGVISATQQSGLTAEEADNFH
jgi:hypothetical protein